MILIGYLLALVIGLLLGLLGGGGAILTMPVLVYVLAVPIKAAVPMSLVVVGLTSAVGAFSHQRQGSIRWDAMLAFGPAAIAGAFGGARLATAISARLQLIIFAVLVLIAAGSMLFGPERLADARDAGDPMPVARPSFLATAAFGATIGLLTGLVGVGGGFLYVPALVVLGGLAMKQAVGTSLALITASCAAGLVSYLGVVGLDWRITAIFSALAVAGVLGGSRLAGNVPQPVLRRGFAGFLVVMGIVVLLRAR